MSPPVVIPAEAIQCREKTGAGKLPPYTDTAVPDAAAGDGVVGVGAELDSARRGAAVAQAERWRANPTVSLMRRWAASCDAELVITIEAAASGAAGNRMAVAEAAAITSSLSPRKVRSLHRPHSP